MAVIENSELNLKPVPKISGINKKDFNDQYVRKLSPVILTDFSNNWPAKEKWTFDYFRKNSGDVMVPVYEDAFANSGKGYMQVSQLMRFGDYIDLISSENTTLRMFLFNIFSHLPELCDDFAYPSLMNYWLVKYPFMFFGGKGSYVDVHYDADLSHVFLTQFEGLRKVLLFSPEDSVNLYRHPFTVSCNVDFRNPDFIKYPNLSMLKGYECTISKGETLFIPSGYWHFIHYVKGGFGLSLRANPSIARRTSGLWNIGKLILFDQNISKIVGNEKWFSIKENIAIKRAKSFARKAQIKSESYNKLT